MAQPNRIPPLKRRSTLGRMGRALLLALAVMTGTDLAAQSAGIRRGDHFYENMVYPKAIQVYTRSLKRHPDQRATERLADAYRQTGNTHMAEDCYAVAVQSPEASTAIKLQYADMLKANGNYAEARRWYEAYRLTGSQPALAAQAIEGCDFALSVIADSTHYTIAAEPFNTKGSEFAPLIYQQGLIVAMERKGGFRRTFNLRNYNGFYDLCYIQKNPSGKGYKVERLPGKVNGRYHEGPATLSARQDELAFTRAFFVRKKAGLAPRDRSRLKILVATFARGKWQNIVALPFNSEAYSCGHPAFSREADLLVFASDMPGGFGGTDLYLSRREGLGWSNPVNLGPQINTAGDERFPFLHDDGTLFFASNGLPGLGGLDLFAATGKAGAWTDPRNLGYPLNSKADDFSITWHRNRATGYFASNRGGSDDIYNFRRQTTVQCTLVDARTGLPIEGVKVRIRDINGKDAQYLTGSNGQFTHRCAWGQELLIDGQASGFLPLNQRVPTNDVSPYQDKALTLRMEPDLAFTLSGKVVDAQTKAAIPNARLRIITPNNENQLLVGADGNFSQRMQENTEYTVVATAPGHLPQFYQFSTVGKTVTENWTFNASLEPGNYLLVEGRTLLSTDNSSIGGVDIVAVDGKSREEVAHIASRADGRYWQVLKPGLNHGIIAVKPGYFVSRDVLPPTRAGRDTTIVLDIPIVPYEVGAIVKVIYYEYNKSDVHNKASEELNDIVYFLRANPEASVELSSHTDSRGGASFNERLSQSRADSAVQYITAKGIAPRRIRAKGYGETMLKNACKDDVNCTEEDHALNRRTEIKVIRIAGGDK